MRCQTKIESESFANIATFGIPANPKDASQFLFQIVGEIPKDFSSLNWFSDFLANSFESFDHCLLLVELWEPKNLHLFYRLRQTYLENRTLMEAPGHIFLDYETADLASFILIGMVCGWRFRLHPAPCFVRAFIDDGFSFTFETDEESNFDEIKKTLGEAKIAFKISSHKK